MFRRISVACVVATLVFTIGAHWAILQTVAWAGMLLTYSQDASFESAVKNTFDGRHPCKLCKVVASGKASEKKQQTRKSISKIDVFLLPKSIESFPVLSFLMLPQSTPFWDQTAEPPLTPPPRCA